MTIVTRFAPSPTGRLHLGHAYSALKAFDFARARGGRFLLRIEDIDPGRTREEFVDGIVDDLHWLGLDWDGDMVRQSERLPLYAEGLERLKAMALVYPCFCTRAEIAASASAPHGEDGPVYSGTCRALTAGERNARKHEPHCWRLDMGRAIEAASQNSSVPTNGEMTWHDADVGWIHASPLSQGDVILARKDVPTSYHLAVTVDDAAQRVTDIIRGQDLFAATHIHRLLQALLDLPTPRYHHHALLTDAAGQRLAKRHDSPTLADLRARGADPVALIAQLRANRLPIGFGLTPA